MLATQVAAEIQERWEEFECLPELERLHKLESLIERHVLAASPCCGSPYNPKSEFFRDQALGDSNRNFERR